MALLIPTRLLISESTRSNSPTQLFGSLEQVSSIFGTNAMIWGYLKMFRKGPLFRISLYIFRFTVVYTILKQVVLNPEWSQQNFQNHRILLPPRLPSFASNWFSFLRIQAIVQVSVYPKLVEVHCTCLGRWRSSIQRHFVLLHFCSSQ